jgi:hypothetical protein
VGVLNAVLPVRHAAEAVPRQHRFDDIERHADLKQFLGVLETFGLFLSHTMI